MYRKNHNLCFTADIDYIEKSDRYDSFDIIHSYCKICYSVGIHNFEQYFHFIFLIILVDAKFHQILPNSPLNI